MYNLNPGLNSWQLHYNQVLKYFPFHSPPLNYHSEPQFDYSVEDTDSVVLRNEHPVEFLRSELLLVISFQTTTYSIDFSHTIFYCIHAFWLSVLQSAIDHIF